MSIIDQSSVEQLEQRILDGDETITAEALDQARSRSRFAGLRDKARERRAAAELEAAREAIAIDVREQLRPLIDAGAHRGDGGPAAERARASITKTLSGLRADLQEVAAAFHAQRARVASELGLEPGGDEVAGVGIGSSNNLEIDGLSYSPAAGTSIDDLLLQMVRDALDEALR